MKWLNGALSRLAADYGDNFESLKEYIEFEAADCARNLGNSRVVVRF